MLAAISTIVALLVAGAIISAFILGTPNTVKTTIVTTPSSITTSATCYGVTLPTNSSGFGALNFSVTVFNITKEYDSWNWRSLSSFKVGSYAFVTTNPATTLGVTQLEPQLLFNVTNSQGRTQRTSVTNLGGFSGQVWPPDMSLQQTLFGGNVTIQWLFLCNSQSVFLKVTTQ